ncbi:MAG TPA: hypothetical protein VGD24_02210 [Gallionella sp.]
METTQPVPLWQVTGRFCAPLPEDWRNRLAARLGQRPRRIGILAELALYGALDCLSDAQEGALPGDAIVRVCSLRGAATAIGEVLAQNRQELPMPFSFLQSQTSQLLPALAAALKWQGDAAIVVTRDATGLAQLAAQQAGANGMLLGWVEELPCQSVWVRLVRSEAKVTGFVAAQDLTELVSPETRYWRSGRDGLEIACAIDTL